MIGKSDSSESNTDNIKKVERRVGERRVGERRNPGNRGNYDGEERRSTKDRRVTIINRLKKDVADRRSLN
jgi:hypothetical protein